MNKLFFKIFSLALLVFLLPSLVEAATVCSKSTVVNFVARDSNGSYISNASVEIYKQEKDANNQTIPTTRVSSAKTKSTGVASLSFKNSSVLSEFYAVKVNIAGKYQTAFWFFDNVLDCGQTVSLEKTLSGIDFTLRDSEGALLKNTKFGIYSQLYSSAGQALKEKGTLITTLNSGSSGSVKIYLPQGSVRGQNNVLNDYYAIEISKDSVKFNYYNIKVNDGQITKVDYYLSSLRVRLQSSSGGVFPAKTKVEIYKQEVGMDNEDVKGDKIGELSIGNDGYGSIDIPAGVYVLAVKGKNNQYEYFWDVEAEEGRVSEHDLTANQNTGQTSATCSNNSSLSVIFRNFKGDYIPGLKYELYEQGSDVSGLPVAGKKAGSGVIGSDGRGTINFKPDPRITYALKVWDKKADLGAFWFFDAVRFTCDYNRQIIKDIPALRIVLRDGNGTLRKNTSFSLYMQKFDADNKPYKEEKDLIANLKTNSGGQALVYVAPYNAYQRGQSGIYALSFKDSNNNLSTVFNINISSEQDYEFTSSANGFRGEVIDAKNKIQTEKEVRLYEQIKNSNGYFLGKQLLKVKTDKSGGVNFEYPGGTYALAVLDNFNRENIFWDVAINEMGATSKKFIVNITNFSLSDGQGEEIPKDASLRLYALSKGGNIYYRAKEIGVIKLNTSRKSSISVATGQYVAVYTGKGGKEYGLAFNAQNNIAQNVNIIVNKKYLVSSEQAQSLSETVVDTSIIPASSGSNAASKPASSQSLQARLKGRILLQVQDKGQAWYVNPTDGQRYYLGRPQDAFNLMRKFGLGVSNKDFSSIENNPSAWSRLAGRILIKPEDSGKAYYFDPINLKLHYLGRPDDAFNVIRSLGLGITTNDLSAITKGE